MASALYRIQKSAFISGVVFIFSSLFFSPSLIHAQGYATKPESPVIQTSSVETSTFSLKPYRSWDFTVGVDARIAFHHVNNTVDLNSNNHNDKTTYLGIAYDFSFDYKHVFGTEAYVLLERRGRADYDAPIAGDRKIHSLFGDYQFYRNGDLGPRVRSFFIQQPFSPAQDINLKVGLFPYGRDIGHGVAFGGKYENYGTTLSGKTELADWDLHWEKEDLNNRIHLGAIADNDRSTLWHHSAAYFTAADTTLKLWDHRWQFYVGWLHDVTGSTTRNNLYGTAVPIQSDDLITPGQYLQLKFGHFKFGVEADRNFGKAMGDGSPTIHHEGYLLVGDASYDFGFFKPRAKIFVGSGNKFGTGNFNSLVLPGTKNKAFSVFSPTNTNLTYSHYQKQYGPFVFMAGGYAVNFGIARPGTFSDPYQFENLVAPNIGFDFTPIKKVYLGIDYWYLRSKEYAYGLDNNLRTIRLPRFLGQEVDLFASYQLTSKITLSVLTGYFFPGSYYRVLRGDTAANNTWASTPRRDGKANGAYQLEAAVEIKY